MARVSETAAMLDGATLTLLDVGAANGAPLRWDPYASLIDYVAVEPDPRSAETLASNKKSGYRSSSTITSGLWSESCELQLNLCRKPEVSSVLKPNSQFLAHFPDAGRFDVVDCTSMKVTTIDAVVDERGISFDAVKVDVQGAELQVLLGAKKALADVLLIEAEVEFVPLYENQPLFGTICHELGRQGFEFVDFLTLYRWHPQHLDGTGQLVFADALFMRSPESIKSQDSKIHRKYAALASIYQRGEMLARLANSVDDSSLSHLLRKLEQAVSRDTSRSQKFLNSAARLARIRDYSLRAHLLN